MIFLQRILFTALFLCFYGQAFPFLSGTDGDFHQHEIESVQETETQHDNLDDGQTHTHAHKHSEDGEEHEHKHDHSKMAQNDFEWVATSSRLTSRMISLEIFSGFREKHFISDHYPFDIFRPPIA